MATTLSVYRQLMATLLVYRQVVATTLSVYRQLMATLLVYRQVVATPSV